jgi:hypothetical protein
MAVRMSHYPADDHPYNWGLCMVALVLAPSSFVMISRTLEGMGLGIGTEEIGTLSKIELAFKDYPFCNKNILI